MDGDARHPAQSKFSSRDAMAYHVNLDNQVAIKILRGVHTNPITLEVTRRVRSYEPKLVPCFSLMS